MVVVVFLLSFTFGALACYLYTRKKDIKQKENDEFLKTLPPSRISVFQSKAKLIKPKVNDDRRAVEFEARDLS